MTLNGVDAIGNLAHHRRGIARTGTNFEDVTSRFHLGRFNHEGDDVGLRYRLALSDRQRPILIRELFKSGLDKGFPGDASHRLEYTSVAHATAGDLDIDHPGAGAGEIKHAAIPPVQVGWPLYAAGRGSLIIICHSCI